MGDEAVFPYSGERVRYDQNPDCVHCSMTEIDRLVAMLGDDVLRDMVCRLSSERYAFGSLSSALGVPEGQVLRRIKTLQGWGLVRLLRHDSATTIVEAIPGGGAETLRRWAYKYCPQGDACGTPVANSNPKNEKPAARAAGGGAVSAPSGGKPRTKQFFDFMVKREHLRLKKESGADWPWTNDRILKTYKFTNIKREFDRTTRWMRFNWTGPNEGRPDGEVVFNCGLFRYFGTIEFAEAIGWQRQWSPEKIIEVAKDRHEKGQPVFTGAYIIPTLGKKGDKADIVCNSILTSLWNARDKIAATARKTNSWRLTAEQMRNLPGFGGTGFMTKEVLQDVMHTPVLWDAFDRNEWCPAGPGARRGLNRVVGRPVDTNVPDSELVEEMRELLAIAPKYLPESMPELELHDIQFQLCEFDKYERVRRGEGHPKTKYDHTKVHR